MSGTQRQGNRVLGSLMSEDGRTAVRMEDRFNTNIEDLWSALTEPERLARWIADIDGDLRVGRTFQATFTSGWVGTGRIETCEPPQRLVVITQQTGEASECVIEARLTASEHQTVLVIEERGMPIEQLAGYGAGWQVHIEDLAAHLAGHERCDIETRWDELQPIYESLTRGKG